MRQLLNYLVFFLFLVLEGVQGAEPSNESVFSNKNTKEQCAFFLEALEASGTAPIPGGSSVSLEILFFEESGKNVQRAFDELKKAKVKANYKHVSALDDLRHSLKIDEWDIILID